MTRTGVALAAWLAVTTGARPSLAAAAGDAKAAGLLARAVAAFGGAAAVDQVTGLEVTGSGTRRVQGADLQVTTVTRYQLPDLYFQEVRLPQMVMKTMASPQGAFLVLGDAALPMPQTEHDALVKLVQRQILSLLRARNDPGFRASAAGPVTVDGKAAERVEVTYEGDLVALAIDPTSGQVLRSEYESPGEGRMAVTYSDYRKVGRLLYPHAMTGTVGGEPAFSLKVESVVVNPPLNRAAFVPGPPAGTSASPSPSPSPGHSPAR